MLEIIKEFEGIIGAVLGVIVTLIATDVVRRFGRRSLYLRECRIEFLNRINDFEGIKDTPTTEFDKVSLFSYDISLVLYNSSDIMYSLFDFELEFIDSNGGKFIHKPFDSDKTRYTSYWVHESFKTINLEPKKLEILNLTGWIHKEELEKLTSSTTIKKVFLNAKNHNHKRFRRKIVG